jgi:alkylhydroperoxidase family enzyme
MTDTPLRRIPRDELPATFQQAWDTLNRLTGQPAFVEVFGSAPELLEFVMNEFYAKIFFGGRVDNRHKQLARLYLSLKHGCRTCNRQNVPGSLEAGISQAQIDAMLDFENGPFTAAEKAVLAYTEQMVLQNHEGELTPELHARLAEHFTDAEICELGVVMAVIGGMAKLSFVLNVVDREPYCEFGLKTASG